MKRFLFALLVLWLVAGCAPEIRDQFDGAAAAFKAASAGRWSSLWWIRGRASYPDVQSIKGGADG